MNRVHKSTVVEMQKDYVHDDQICLTSVVFIPDDISQKIMSDVIEKLKKTEPHHYFYLPESMHVTIKNIRTINKPPVFSETDINKVNELFNEIIPQFPIFEFTVEDVLMFPTSLSIMGYSDETLQKLVYALDEGLQKIGVPDNKKYFSTSVFWGNITICRFAKNPQIAFINEVQKMRDVKIGKFKVEKVQVITCNAVCHPASRRIVGKYDLGKE
ncbi:MAG: hypothetical protein HYV32_01500 [Candidatus Kerfeldbacteria bacterium]|nr:hypothetical protein [Candidatus Kerfeldbacteria bacterium]